MINPITGNRVYFTAYLLICIALFFIQISIEYFAFEIPVWYAAVDSLVYNLLFFLLGIGMWFPIRFMPFGEKKVLFALLNHLLLGGLMLFLWLISGYFITQNFTGDNAEIKNFIESSWSYRAIVGGLIFILIIMVYYLIIYSGNLKEKIKDEANLKTLVREAELSALKAQINPHFLFNSLNSISSLTIRDPAKARKMIIELSEFLRYSLKHNEKEVNSLEEELKNSLLYLEIERIRFGNRLCFKSIVPEDCKSRKLPNMILQPLFENTIKHGVYESLEPVTIHMECCIKNDELVIEIKNNFDPEQQSRVGAGLGLKNIQSRLKIIYGKDNLLTWSKTGNIFLVSLRIP